MILYNLLEGGDFLKNKKIFVLFIIAVIVAVAVGAMVNLNSEKDVLIAVKSENELKQIYQKDYSDGDNKLLKILTMPFSLLTYGAPMEKNYELGLDYGSAGVDTSKVLGNLDSIRGDASNASTSTSTTKEHSTTNIQVENVDEADITKTDGDYIYSLSGSDVVITNVQDPSNIKIDSKIQSEEDYNPEDLILYNDKLVVISTKYIKYSKSNTLVSVYDVTKKDEPKLVKSCMLPEKYYTSRSIDGKLLVIASGKLREEDNKVVTYYEEDNSKKEIGLENIKRLKKLISNDQTLIATINLQSTDNVKVNSYLFNVENAYISEKNMYLLNELYSNENSGFEKRVKNLFGIKGVIGFFNYMINEDYDDYGEYDDYTNIYKFSIQEDGSIEYLAKNKVRGTTINQFSLDEYNENLRVGLETSDGSKVVVLDNKLNKIGETECLSKGEKMYSTRFLGEKAYMVTYKNTDPLYVIDLSNPKEPTVLGKLKIPGYSTYLHPYDENHLIGIGMQTKETVYRDSQGRVTSTSARITGMKMALFDVSDVNNPKQISQTIIGDSRTTSAILTNHKALLFSKEKGILAIPVNSYPSDFEVESSSDDISKLVSQYTNYNKNYTAEGYAVYNINLTDGFNLKGIINHEIIKTSGYRYGYSGKLLRGLWIEDNLYTVSEKMIKVNKLDDLSQISELEIGGDE